MSQKKLVQLEEPLEIGGNQISEVEVRRSTIGDEEDAMQAAIQMKKGKNPLCVEMCLMSRLARLPYDVIRSMHGPDYTAIRRAITELNGTQEVLDEDENPMMP